MAHLSSEKAPGDAGYLPRLLSAAAFVTQRATEDSLSELRLTQERTAVLRILASRCADEAALCAASGLDPDCVHDCVLALECCGYAACNAGMWAITSAGARIQAQAEQAEARLVAGANDDALRRELSTLIRALAPPPPRPRDPGPRDPGPRDPGTGR